MMQQLSIGRTIIPYTIRQSDTAQRKRIIVTPNSVEVVTPKNTSAQDVAAFIQKKRRWVYDKQEEMQERLAHFAHDTYMHLQSGAKIPFRGRNMRLQIVREKAEKIEIRYQNGFNITVPKHIPEALVEASIGLELTFWLKDRLKEDARQMTKQYCQVLGIKYKGIKIGAPARLWGSCTLKGVITLNWHLIAAPRAVLEYVVLHELCHVQHRNHSKEFWALLASHMPDYAIRKRWLETSHPQYSL